MLSHPTLRLRQGLLVILLLLLTPVRLPAPIQEPEPSATPSVTPKAQAPAATERATNREKRTGTQTDLHKSQAAQSSTTQTRSNSRLDGTWIGTETVGKLTYESKTAAPRSTTTTIIIAHGGTVVGVLDGLCSGRFDQVWWKGNTLNFKARDCTMTVSLSSDGKTLIENGVAERPARMTVGGASEPNYRYQLSGMYHRQ